MTELQEDIFTKRWRRSYAPEPKEVQIQISLIDHLRIRARPGVLYFHIPNGGFRNNREAAKLKAMGTLPGVADLQFLWYDGDGRLAVLFLELKARGRKPPPAQWLFADAARATGAKYEFADSIDTALQILSRYDLLAR